MDKLEKFTETLKKFVPNGFENYLAKLILNGQVKFKIVNGRKSKLGDFRIGITYEKPIITVNGDLNPFAFLITSIHELAHLHTFLKYGNQIAPHGSEWKNEFRALLLPIIDSKLLPNDIHKALLKSLVNTKASSCSDIQLSRTLRNYDINTSESAIFLEDLEEGERFEVGAKIFVKGKLRRSRYLCLEYKTNKPYLIHRLATIKRINYE